MNLITRREFIESSGLAAAMFIGPPVYSATSETSSTRYSQRLLVGWQFHSGSLGGIWEVWRGKEISENHWQPTQLPQDRKSTRLNSSHLVISYAVFCLKK